MKTSNIRDRLSLLQGIRLAELGVMNAVGSTTVQYFRNLQDIINRMPVNIMGMSWYKLKDYIEQEEDSLSKKRKDRKFLEGLAPDKRYLEGMIKKLSAPSGRSKIKGPTTNLATKSILNEAEKALGFLEDRREFWSQQKPDYDKGPAEEQKEPPKWNTIQLRMVNKRVAIFENA